MTTDSPFHVIFGPAGSGKSTQAARLAFRHLRSGIPVHVLHRFERIDNPWEITEGQPLVSFNRVEPHRAEESELMHALQASIEAMNQLTEPGLLILDDLLPALPSYSGLDGWLKPLIKQGHRVMVIHHTPAWSLNMQDLNSSIPSRFMDFMASMKSEGCLETIQVSWCLRPQVEMRTVNLETFPAPVASTALNTIQTPERSKGR